MTKKIFLFSILMLALTATSFAQGSSTNVGTADTTNKTSGKTTKRAPVFRPTKDQIIQVQLKLKEKKLYAGDAEGKYNADTRTAIKSFQKDNGLKQTGTLNRATLEKFEVELTDAQKLIPVLASSYASAEKEKAPAKNSAGSKTRAPIFRATVDQIKAAQRMLKEKSMYPGEETGKLNTDTRAGLKKFQEENGIKVTGTLNAATLEKMGIPLTDKQKTVGAASVKAGN
jgi:peptidoglycan hydrolase-like protein with peptidoglycan-binding domain